MILVTGASGKLGTLTIEKLLEKVPAEKLIAGVRSPEKAEALKQRGVLVRTLDYTQPATLGPALAGVEKVLLISSNEVGQRAAQHKAVIDAAKKANVKLLAYTSVLKAPTATFIIAKEHQETEQYLKESGLPAVLLRNGWYTENYTDNLASTLQHGAILGAAQNGRVAIAERADFAEAAAVVLTTPDHAGRAYELAGDTSYTLADLAAEFARQSGKPVVYKDLPPSELSAALAGFGLPRAFADVLADSDVAISRGELDDTSGELRKLIGRPTTPLAETVRRALARIAA